MAGGPEGMPEDGGPPPWTQSEEGEELSPAKGSLGPPAAGDSQQGRGGKSQKISRGGQRRGTEWAEEDAPFGWEWSVELQRNDQETLSGSLGTKRKPGFCWREVERLRASSGHP